MLPSDMNLKIKTGTVRYNNKILASDGNFSLGKNDEVNLTVPAIKSHKTNSLAKKPNFSHKNRNLSLQLIIIKKLPLYFF